MSQDLHAYPENDQRAHVTDDGVFCPCMPDTEELEDGSVMVRHYSYDGREVGEACQRALDLLGLALTNHNHQWTDEERDAYTHASNVLQRHYDVPEVLDR